MEIDEPVMRTLVMLTIRQAGERTTESEQAWREANM